MGSQSMYCGASHAALCGGREAQVEVAVATPAAASSSAEVHAGVTFSTEGNQILAGILAGMAAKLFVVDL